MKIRKFKSTDKNAVIELWRTVFSDDPPHNEPANVLEAKLAVDNLIFVAEDKAKVIGACMAGYDGHRGWLYSVAVYPEYRRGGTGTKLIKFAMETLKKWGVLKLIFKYARQIL